MKSKRNKTYPATTSLELSCRDAANALTLTQLAWNITVDDVHLDTVTSPAKMVESSGGWTGHRPWAGPESANKVKSRGAMVSKQLGHKRQTPLAQSETLKATVGGTPARIANIERLPFAPGNVVQVCRACPRQSFSEGCQTYL